MLFRTVSRYASGCMCTASTCPGTDGRLTSCTAHDVPTDGDSNSLRFLVLDSYEQPLLLRFLVLDSELPNTSAAQALASSSLSDLLF